MIMHSTNSNLSTSTNNNNNQSNTSQQFPPSDVFTTRADWSLQQQALFHNNNNNVSDQKMQEKMSIDHLLQLMSQVGVSIKAGDFSSQLAENIFVLCQQLKTYGQHLEQTNKNDLNRIFVSLRQACCRDNGQLGTPCRLKMMELVELRAMGWRPNYSHTQYYLNRPEQNTATNTSGQKQNQQQATTPQTSGQFNSTQFTAQSFVPSNTQALNYCVPLQLLPCPLRSTSTNGCWPNPIMPVANPFMPQSPHMQLSGLARGGVPPLISPENDWQNRQMAAYIQNATLLSKSQSSTPNSPLLGGIRHLNMAGRMDTSNISTKSNKCQQLREEMTIRNCDSGKIMGVKGRRVALVEELSKTVISFQKVETKNKDRVLTITGTNQESIQQAKLLIEDTIRRNVSPIRLLTTSDVAANEDNNAEEEEEDPGISIETSKDGTLKLCCADPEVLQAAQAALSDYLNRAHRSSRMTAEERELRKERRKSMPLQSADNSAVEVVAPKQEPMNQETRRTLTGSTPNLAAQGKQPEQNQLEKQINPSANTTSALASVFEDQEKTLKYSRREMLALRENNAEQSAQIKEFGQ
uniref:K Homology domain-containing protein n=1 Tax=Ditylenchus dipsaci TaxID=166011 RepID=A0A915EGT2_9BILA